MPAGYGGRKDAKSNATSATSASGLWKLDDHVRAKASGAWPVTSILLEYLVVAGGGGSGGTQNNSGPHADAGQVQAGSLSFTYGLAQTITVGSGGTAGGGWGGVSSTSGGNSVLASVVSAGGKGSANNVCCPGASSGGTGGTGLSSAGTLVTYGQNNVALGIASSITGTSVNYGNSYSHLAINVTPGAQTPNRGHGAFAVWSSLNRSGGPGGSGVVILKYPDNVTASYSSGVSKTSTAASGFIVDTVTAAGAADTVAFNPGIPLEYLVIAGGGPGGGGIGGGGGAGGYRSNIAGESSGGASVAEAAFSIAKNTAYAVTVGAGGARGATEGATGTSGSNSTFATFTSTGGGYGGGSHLNRPGANGGSGGGEGARGSSYPYGQGTAGQGFRGGSGSGGDRVTGGGGGAGEVGQNYVNTNQSGRGGNGVTSSITGSAVTRAGGGGGGSYNGAVSGAGGSGGGGAGNAAGSPQNGAAATVNTGSGGGGGSGNNGLGGNGGSGVVILRYPASYTATFSAGVTQTTATVSGFKVSTITAAGANDTVTFS